MRVHFHVVIGSHHMFPNVDGFRYDVVSSEEEARHIAVHWNDQMETTLESFIWKAILAWEVEVSAESIPLIVSVELVPQPGWDSFELKYEEMLAGYQFGWKPEPVRAGRRPVPACLPYPGGIEWLAQPQYCTPALPKGKLLTANWAEDVSDQPQPESDRYESERVIRQRMLEALVGWCRRLKGPS